MSTVPVIPDNLLLFNYRVIDIKDTVIIELSLFNSDRNISYVFKLVGRLIDKELYFSLLYEGVLIDDNIRYIDLLVVLNNSLDRISNHKGIRVQNQLALFKFTCVPSKIIITLYSFNNLFDFVYGLLTNTVTPIVSIIDINTKSRPFRVRYYDKNLRDLSNFDDIIVYKDMALHLLQHLDYVKYIVHSLTQMDYQCLRID